MAEPSSLPSSDRGCHQNHQDRDKVSNADYAVLGCHEFGGAISRCVYRVSLDFSCTDGVYDQHTVGGICVDLLGMNRIIEISDVSAWLLLSESPEPQLSYGRLDLCSRPQQRRADGSLPYILISRAINGGCRRHTKKDDAKRRRMYQQTHRVLRPSFQLLPT